MIRDTFQKMSAWTQVLFLFLFFIIGQALTLLIIQNVLHIDIAVGIENLSLSEIWRIQGVSAFLSFLTPVLICASLFFKKVENHLAINKGFSLLNLSLAILAIFAIQPFISLVGEWNQQINLPENFRVIEESAQRTMEKLILSDPSPSTLMINILILALLPAIAEELFFRGIIQQAIQKISRNSHIAVWATAIIFSFIHFQFYGFIPRVLLGALLGYIFVWSRSLWLPIIVHFINNAAAILLFRQYHDNKNVIEFGTGATWWFAPIGLTLTILILLYMRRVYKRDADDESMF